MKQVIRDMVIPNSEEAEKHFFRVKQEQKDLIDQSLGFILFTALPNETIKDLPKGVTNYHLDATVAGSMSVVRALMPVVLNFIFDLIADMPEEEGAKEALDLIRRSMEGGGK